MKRLYLIQAQATLSMGTEMYIPYSVGCLWAYAYQFYDIQQNIKLIELIFRRELQQNILDRITDPDIIGFSVYAWNIKYNLKLAEKIKKIYPNCKIIFGGPAVESHWLEYKFIDSLVIGEGETAFAKALKDFLIKNQLESIYIGERLSDLNIPSPYTTGVFDNIIKENPDINWFMIFETTRGCPYQCAFCDWGGGIYTKIRKFPMEKIISEIKWATQNPIFRIGNADANFGIFKERDLEITRSMKAALEDSNNKLEMVQNTYAKNTNDTCFEIEKELGKYGYGMTISVQSLNTDVLGAIKRKNMGMNDLEKMFFLARKYNVRTYTELILGLPLETKNSFIDGLNKLLELGQHESIYVWLLNIIPTSEMGNLDYMSKYGYTTIDVKDVLQTPDEAKNDLIDDTTEIIKMVKSTSTLTTQDIIDCNRYTWMIEQFHLSGFTEFISKYCRVVLDIPYRSFYDKLFETLETDKKCQPILDKFNDLMVNYFNNGEIPDNYRSVVAWTFPIDFEQSYMYENREYFIDVGLSVAESMGSLSPDQKEELYNLQHAYFYRPEQEYPYTITASVDISNWNIQRTTYQIQNRTSNKKHQISSFGQAYEMWLKKTDIIKCQP